MTHHPRTKKKTRVPPAIVITVAVLAVIFSMARDPENHFTGMERKSR